MRLGPTTTRTAALLVAGLAAGLATPALALAANGEAAPESPFTAAGALIIVSVMAVVLFFLGLFGVRGAVHDARIEHDSEE